MNSWESYALQVCDDFPWWRWSCLVMGLSHANTLPQYNYADDERGRVTAWTHNSTTTDAIIYPGLYAPSGFDMLSILVCSPYAPDIRHIGAIL